MDENDLLNEALEQETPRGSRRGNQVGIPAEETEGGRPDKHHEEMFCQWSAGPNENFRPSGSARKRLEAGVYEPMHDDNGMFFQRLHVVTDALIELDDNASHRVLAGMRVFWDSKDEYVKRGIIYKRGVLLWGPAGSGKTATLALLSKELIAADGLVIVCSQPDFTAKALAVLRRIEPDRNLILMMEDIDELIQKYGEHGILSLLDGEQQIQNVVNLATTNFPEMLGARIVNRPSRFDERIHVGMPNIIARAKYLAHATRSENITDEERTRWVLATDGFSVAHLRELVVAVFCLKQEYEDVLERLRKMQTRVKSRDEFKTEPVFAAAKGA